jgi:hypothetical protein
MSDSIVDAAAKHPPPEGHVYTYGTAGVSDERIIVWILLTSRDSSEQKRTKLPYSHSPLNASCPTVPSTIPNTNTILATRARLMLVVMFSTRS